MFRGDSCPDIYDYDNYRTFLNDCFLYYKERIPGFTHRYFSQKAGLTSPSALKEVITGKLGISRSTLPKYILGFELHNKESKYFSLLVRFNQAKDEKTKNEYYVKLVEIKRRTHVLSLASVQFEYCNKWYHSVIREMIGMENFNNDPLWIAHNIRPIITAAQAKKTIVLLKKIGLITEDSLGKLSLSAVHIDIDPEVDRLATRNLNRSMIVRAGDAIEAIAPVDREISHATIGVSEDTYEYLQQRIRDFKAEILAHIAQDTSSAKMVCQMNLQLFPVTAKPNLMHPKED